MPRGDWNEAAMPQHLVESLGLSGADSWILGGSASYYSWTDNLRLDEVSPGSVATG